MKLKLIALSCLISASAFSAAPDYSELNKDMRIMKRIFETALSESEKNRFGNHVDARYLAKQGMVFTISSGALLRVPSFNGDWESWGESVGASALSIVESVIPAVEPFAPEAAVEMEHELEMEMENLRSERSEEMEKLREELEMLREKARETKEVYRDSLRELREIERERYRAESDRRKELDEKRLELEKRIEKNKQGMEAYQKKMEEYREIRRQGVRKKKENVVNNALATLCDYSASSKSLPSDEHVTLIFEDFAEGSKKEDQILVFKKSQLSKCDSDEEGVNRMKRDAIAYQQ